MASTAEIAKPPVKNEEELVPAPVPIESAWKTPLTKKLNKDTPSEPEAKVKTDNSKKSSDKTKENVTSEPKTVESKVTNSKQQTEKQNVDADNSEKDKDDKEKSGEDKEQEKENSGPKPKIFDNLNYVEAPPPKTNPWTKCLQSNTGTRCIFYSTW